MALKNVANKACTVAVTAGGTGNASITTSESSKVKANEQGVYRGPISVTVSGATSGDCSGATGVGIINPSAEKMKADGLLVIREGDKKENVNVVGVLPNSQPCDFDVTIEITNAGQTKLKAQ